MTLRGSFAAARATDSPSLASFWVGGRYVRGQRFLGRDGRTRPPTNEFPVNKRALIIANPAARRGQQAVLRVVDKLARRLAERGTDSTTCLTEREGPREADYVRKHADSVEAIYAVGGDGTVRACVMAMTAQQRRRVVIGFVPMGNANVLARTVGIDLDDPDRAAEQVLSGRATDMDIGCINGEPAFLLMMDCGYFARVVQSITKTRNRRGTGWLYRHFGNPLYATVGLLQMIPGRSAPVRLDVDGAEVATSSNIAIANVRVYAKTGSLCPAADPSDGLLDYNAMRGNRTLRYSLAAMRARPTAAISHLGTGKRFELTAMSRPFVCQVDGDPLPGGPFRSLQVEVQPAHYRLIVPK